MEEEERNYCSLALLLLRVGTLKLRLYFKTQWNASSRTDWTDCTQNGADLLRVFEPLPYEKSSVKSGNTSKWDLSLLIRVLLQSRPPFVSTSGLVTALETLKNMRNELCRAAGPRIKASDFRRLWYDVCNALSLFGAKSKDFNKVEKDVKRPWNFLLPEIKGCAAQERDILKLLERIKKVQETPLQSLEQRQNLDVQSTQGQSTVIKERQEAHPNSKFVTIVNYNITATGSAQVVAGKKARFEIHDTTPEKGPIKAIASHQQHEESSTEVVIDTTSKRVRESSTKVVMDTSEQVRDYTKKLKSSIKSYTGFLPKLEEQTLRTGKISTNMTIQREIPKGFEKANHEEKMARRSEHEIAVLNKCSEMFLWPEKYAPKPMSKSFNPKSILVIGKAGIGKSLFCKKVIREWADEQLFHKQEKKEVPNFQFAFLLMFRHFNSLGHKAVNIKEFLNLSPTLDEHSAVRETLFKSITEDPEKFLIILDGYDEYLLRNDIVTKFEEDYPNNPRDRLPIPALIAKLLKGKILKGSVVVVTSRPREANYMGEIIFDAKVEIKGFSPVQVIDYIERYFQHHQELMNIAIDHIKGNQKLMSFAHIPVICYLMCYYMELLITKHKKEHLPHTRTDLYHKVIKVFIKKHHADFKGTELKEDHLDVILETLSEIAVKLTKNEKYYFSEKDLRELKVSEENIASLFASGLLDCFPVTAERAPLFSQVKLEYTFSHLTIQEYLSAVWHAKNAQVPDRAKQGDVTLTFFAELLARKKDVKLMRNLLKCIEPKDENDDAMRLLTLHCLQEFGDKTLAIRKIQKLYDKYCSVNGWIVFDSLTDMDCPSIAYLFDIIHSLKKESTNKTVRKPSFVVNTLYILKSWLTLSGVRVICNSLVNSTVTELDLSTGNLDDSHCIQIITDLYESKVTKLKMPYNRITGENLEGIVEALVHKKCHLILFNLCGNKLTKECKETLSICVRQQNPNLQLILE